MLMTSSLHAQTETLVFDASKPKPMLWWYKISRVHNNYDESVFCKSTSGKKWVGYMLGNCYAFLLLLLFLSTICLVNYALLIYLANIWRFFCFYPVRPSSCTLVCVSVYMVTSELICKCGCKSLKLM